MILQVRLNKANFKPAPHHEVDYLMEKLINFINEDADPQFGIIKIAIFHHAFTYIHPFDNGNGRVVRLLTYVLLLQFGFHIKLIFNPSAVLYLDRENYYNMLASADTGNNENWIRYFSSGLTEQFKTVEKLADYDYLFNQAIIPSIEKTVIENIINHDEKNLLLKILGSNNINIDKFKAGDINGYEVRRKTYLIGQLKNKNIVVPLKEQGREYRLDMTFFQTQLFKQLRALNLMELD